MAQDHPESIIMWETDELPKNTVMDSDAALFIMRDKANNDSRPGALLLLLSQTNSCTVNFYADATTSDLMYHLYTVPFADNTDRLGYPHPRHAICVSSVQTNRHRSRIYHTFLSDDT